MSRFPKRVHLLGIGGVGMGALAGLFHAAGVEVTGSEGAPVYPPMSLLLEDLKIPVFVGYKPENLDQARPDLVIIGNVIRRENPEAKEVLNRHLPYLSLPEALRRFFIAGRKSLVVAGTHGKTTTSALMAFALEAMGESPTFLLGGLLRDRMRNFALGKGGYTVLEGDEYDSAFFDKRAKFVHYAPFGAILTSVEFDHADIYPDFQALKETFAHFVSLIPEEGLLVLAADDPGAREVASWAKCQKISYGLGEEADLRLLERRVDSSGQRVRLAFRGEAYEFFVPLIGLHNALNALAVWGLLRGLGFAPEAIARAFQGFPGTKRRQEVLLREPVTIIDDFAHHPTAIATTLDGLRRKVGDGKILAIIEPRSNTMRLGNHKAALAGSTGCADEVIWYQPPGLDWSLDSVLSESPVPASVSESLDEIVAKVVSHKGEPLNVVVMSNGGFGGIHQKLLDTLAE